MAEINIPLQHRLSFRQARSVVFVALFVGTLLSLVQVLVDYQNHQKEQNDILTQMLASMTQAASFAAYNFDAPAALQVTEGLVGYKPIVQSQITDDFGRVLAGSSKSDEELAMNLPYALFGENKTITIDLKEQVVFGEYVGQLSIIVNPNLSSESFFDRSIVVFFSGVIRNIILSLILLVVFHATLTRVILEAHAHTLDEETKRIPIPKSHEYDELGALLAAFNQRFDTIEEKNKIIQDANTNLELTVQERTEKLKETIDELEAFCYSISHDLRAPLRSVHGFSSALEEDLRDQISDEQKDMFNRVTGAAERMDTLIQDLLQLSRVFRHELQREQLDLSKISGEVFERISLNTPEDKLDTRVEWHCDANIMAYADPGLVTILMENLLSNAWKYSINGSSVAINVGIMNHGGESILYVRDNGVGFNMKYRDKLFEPFQRLHSPKEFQGTGVGLAIVQRIIKRHEGRIWADSRVGEGTTMYFTLEPPPDHFDIPEDLSLQGPNTGGDNLEETQE
ncbi:hypothetical protein A9Q99_06760 [Gammaproteobacteria bacterium 45_16_T64]|nr:hypothetical protein A9Q99_06760 [Gammaproteobacteria bacterium 45_16_T64]